jgi:hypothetical protein
MHVCIGGAHTLANDCVVAKLNLKTFWKVVAIALLNGTIYSNLVRSPIHHTNQTLLVGTLTLKMKNTIPQEDQQTQNKNVVQ